MTEISADWCKIGATCKTSLCVEDEQNIILSLLYSGPVSLTCLKAKENPCLQGFSSRHGR